MPGVPAVLEGAYQALRHAAERAQRYWRSMGYGYLAGGFAELGAHLRALRYVRGYVPDGDLAGFEKAIRELVAGCDELCVVPEPPYRLPEQPAPWLISYRLRMRPDRWTRIFVKRRGTNEPMLDGDEIAVDDTLEVTFAARLGARVTSMGSTTSFNMQELSRSQDAKGRIISAECYGVVPQEDVHLSSSGIPILITLSRLRSDALTSIDKPHDACRTSPKGPFKFKVELRDYKLDVASHPKTYEEFALHRARGSQFKLLLNVYCVCDRPFTHLKDYPGFPLEYFDPEDGGSLHFVVDLTDEHVTMLPGDEGLLINFAQEFSLLDYYDSKWHDYITSIVCSHADDGSLRIRPHLIAIPQ